MIYNFYNAKNLKIYGGAGVAISHFAFSNSFFGSQNPGVSDNNIGASNPYSFNSIDTSLELTAGVKVYGNFEIFGKFFTNTLASFNENISVLIYASPEFSNNKFDNT